jgi:hypothetical protein
MAQEEEEESSVLLRKEIVNKLIVDQSRYLLQQMGSGC